MVKKKAPLTQVLRGRVDVRDAGAPPGPATSARGLCVARRVQRLALVAPDRGQPGHERGVVLEARRRPPNK